MGDVRRKDSFQIFVRLIAPDIAGYDRHTTVTHIFKQAGQCKGDMVQLVVHSDLDTIAVTDMGTFFAVQLDGGVRMVDGTNHDSPRCR